MASLRGQQVIDREPFWITERTTQIRMISISWNTKPNQLYVGAVVETSKAAPNRLEIKKGSRSYGTLTTPGQYISKGSSILVTRLYHEHKRYVTAYGTALMDRKKVLKLTEPDGTEFKALLCICCPPFSLGHTGSSNINALSTSQPHRLEVRNEKAGMHSNVRTSRTHSIYQETWAKSLKSILPYWIQNLAIVRHEITIYTSFKHLILLFISYIITLILCTIPYRIWLLLIILNNQKGSKLFIIY